MKHILVPLAMILALVGTGFARKWSALNEVPDDVGLGGGLVAAGDRGYIFAIQGDDNSNIYAYDINTGEWIEDMDDVPYDIIQAGSISYDTKQGMSLYVVYDDDSPDSDSICVYRFLNPPSSGSWQGVWLDDQLPLPMSAQPGPGVATVFRPDLRPANPGLLSGYLYFLRGDGTASLYRRPIQQVPYTVEGIYAPPDNGYANAADVLLDWTPRVEPGLSQVQLDNSADFDSPIVDTTTEQSQYYITSGLTANTNYYWHARYKINDTHWTQWSSTWSFQTTLTATPRGLYAFPEDGAILATTRPVFNWTWTSGATLFRIQIDDNPNFSNPAIDTQVTTNEYRATSDLADGEYYWRTKYHQGQSWSSWGTTCSFSLENGWTAMTDVPATVGEGAAMCYTEHSGAESLWVLCGNYSSNFYNYSVHNNSWSALSITPLDQYYGASITAGPWASGEILVNCGGYEPLVMDSIAWQFRQNHNPEWSHLKYLPSWTDPVSCTAYCAAGSGLCFVPAGLSSGLLYLMTAGAQRPDFWSLAVSADDGGGQANPLGPVPLPVRVVYEPDRITISFSAAKPSPACARIYDASGRFVEKLDGTPAEGGGQEFVWNESGRSGSRVARGAYFFTAVQNSRPVSLKLVVR